MCLLIIFVQFISYFTAGICCGTAQCIVHSNFIGSEQNWWHCIIDVYVPVLTYGHELWVVTERMRSRVQAVEMRYLRRVAGLTLRDGVRSTIREDLKVDSLLLLVERSQLRWFGHLIRMPPGGFR